MKIETSFKRTIEELKDLFLPTLREEIGQVIKKENIKRIFFINSENEMLVTVDVEEIRHEVYLGLDDISNIMGDKIINIEFEYGEIYGNTAITGYWFVFRKKTIK